MSDPAGGRPTAVRVPSRMERALGRALHDELASAREDPDEPELLAEPVPTAGIPLDWEAFSARFYPGRGRHDLQAIVAYSTYRSSSGDATPEA
jgi:hypothetical protein